MEISKRAEEVENQLWYKRVFETLNEGVIITDIKGMIIKVNPAFEKTTGYLKDEVIGENPNILNSGHHDLNFYIDMWTEIHEEGKWQGEIINQKKNGTIFLEYLKINAVRDDRGNIAYYIGVFSDITKERRNESNLLLYGRVFENTSEGVLITDKNGKIILVNPAFTEITGYLSSEAIGKNPSILRSAHHDYLFYKSMWSCLHVDGKWQGEIWNKRKNGEIYPLWLNINAVENAAGEVINYVGVFNDITNQKESEKQLQQLAHYDTLTGLANRVLFYKKLNQAIEESKLLNKVMAVLFLDIDRLKLINDSLGHSVGDKLLQNIAERIRREVGEGDLVARLGGDEFVVLVQDVGNLNEIKTVVEKIIQEIATPFQWESHELISTCSIGISLYPFDGLDIDTLLKNADSAMYKAKVKGNCFQFFEEYMFESTSRKMMIANGLQKAISRNEFSIFYQPQIDITNNSMVGLEALIRWNHNEMGSVSPGEFIPIAEETGVIIPIGEWVIRTVCEQIKQWENEGFQVGKVAINLSPRQFLDNSLIEVIEKTLVETGVKPENLEFEITEGISMYQIDSIIDKLNALIELGIGVSVDDFGTGHSSLSYLKNFPLKTIKIDRSLLSDVSGDKVNASIILAIINIANVLGMDVIAEGIETKEELEFLLENKCKYAQGYFFGKPMPTKAIKEYMLNKRKNTI